MYPSETIKEGRGENWKRSGRFCNKGSTRIHLETRRFGEWGKSHGKKGDATKRREMVAT